jgi:hypothetical protein
MCLAHARPLTAHARAEQAENNNAAGWRVEVSTGRGGGGGGRGGGGGGGRGGGGGGGGGGFGRGGGGPPGPPGSSYGRDDRGRDERPAERYGGGGGGGYERGRDERCAHCCRARCDALAHSRASPDATQRP